MRSVAKSIGFSLVMLFAGFVSANEGSVVAEIASPQSLIQNVTDQVLVAITGASEYYKEDPERFYAEIDVIMAPVMDYTTFARSVMGRYGSSSAYRALATDDEKSQFRARIELFTAALRQTLMNTYGKGLMTFNGQTIEVLPLAEEEVAKFTAGRLVEVVQVIRSDDGSANTVYYKLKPNRAGEWKLRNVIIDTTNMGKVYQSQFLTAVRDHKGDVDKAIAQWGK